jgi:hypothetical protein
MRSFIINVLIITLQISASISLVPPHSIFTLFSFQLDTLTILYIYNFGSFIYLYMFRTDRSIIRRSNAFIAQAASGTVSLVVVCLAWPLVLEAACAIKALDLLMMD